MSDLQRRTTDFLRSAAGRLRGTALDSRLALGIERLISQVDQPCTVAVVGRVKAGKSTFINALLKDDLAPVGATETTATINVFRYGWPADASRPVRCHWRDRPPTDEPRAFLDGLQGAEAESLARAEGIDHLEYLLPLEILRDMTIVDTPGTGAVVEEHQTRVDEFMNRRRKMRERSQTDTNRLCDSADAVIYLVGPAPREGDRTFLEKEFADVASGAGGFNAVGVMAKIDLHDTVFERRHELATAMIRQFDGRLNTIVPVSAALQRAVDRLTVNPALLERLVRDLRRVPIERLTMLVESGQEFFLEEEYDDCPLSPADRHEIWRLFSRGGDAPWRAFALVAMAAADSRLDTSGILTQLREHAGFAPLLDVVRRRFAERSHILRCAKLLGVVRGFLNEIAYRDQPALEEKLIAERPRLDALLAAIERMAGPRDVTLELESLVRARYDTGRQIREVNAVHAELDTALSELDRELRDDAEDFEALRWVEEAPERFSADELREVRALLGRDGLDVDARLSAGRRDQDYVGRRQMAMRHLAMTARDRIRQEVFTRAELRYGAILHALSQ